MVSYLGSLVQFSAAAGRAGRCRQISSLCVGSIPHVLATLGLPHTGVSVLSPSTLFRLLVALYGAGPALSAVPVFGSSTAARIRLRLCVVFPGLSGSGSQRLAGVLPGAARLFPPRRAAQAARGLAHSPRVRRAFFLCGPSAQCQSGLRKSTDRNRGPVCRVGGGGFSGAEFAPFPSPLPPSSSGDGAALLCSVSVPLFCEPLVVCSGWLIFPCSPTV